MTDLSQTAVTSRPVSEVSGYSSWNLVARAIRGFAPENERDVSVGGSVSTNTLY
jgi:hypothetical protein